MNLGTSDLSIQSLRMLVGKTVGEIVVFLSQVVLVILNESGQNILILLEDLDLDGTLLILWEPDLPILVKLPVDLIVDGLSDFGGSHRLVTELDFLVAFLHIFHIFGVFGRVPRFSRRRT